MTLAGAILKKVKSDTSMGVKKNKYSSPPPEIEDLAIVKKKKKRRINKYATIRAKVDTTAPLLDAAVQKRNLITWRNDVYKICAQNMALLRAIKQMHFRRGKVDCKWDVYPSRCMLYYYKRVDFYNKVQKDNEIFYHRLLNTEPRIVSTSELRHDWKENRRRIVYGAQNKFVLFPPIPQESMEDRAFAAPAGVRRPRAYMTLCVRNCSVMGDLTIELFTDLCPNTCQLFLDLLDGDETKMLLSDSGINGANEILVKVVSPEGQTFTAYFSEDTLIEEVKNRAIDFFYPTGESGSSRYKIVRVYDTTTLHDFLTLSQEQVIMQEELLLVERRLPEAGTLWDLGAIRAPQQGTIAAATASLPAPQNSVRQPNLQSLLSTNELSYELKKILISLIEAGARLAAAGRNYEMTLAQLSAALDEPQRIHQPISQVITPEEIASRLDPLASQPPEESSSSEKKTDDLFKRAEHLQRFLEKFRAWRFKIAEVPNVETIGALKDLGFSATEAEEALKHTGCNVPAAASWLIGERGSSLYELINGLPDGLILQTLLKQPQIQRGLLNTRMLIAFIAMIGQTGSASLWLNSPHGSPLLSQISRTYHSEKYCLAVNQFSEIREEENPGSPSTSRQRN